MVPETNMPVRFYLTPNREDSSASILVAEPLDYETTRNFMLRVRAQNVAAVPLAAFTVVYVNVTGEPFSNLFFFFLFLCYLNVLMIPKCFLWSVFSVLHLRMFLNTVVFVCNSFALHAFYYLNTLSCSVKTSKTVLLPRKHYLFIRLSQCRNELKCNKWPVTKLSG